MVLVATYMEAGTICRLVDQLLAHLGDAHVLIVDDRSPDGTADLVRRRYRDRPVVEVVSRDGRRCYSLAMREGFRRFLDSDAERLLTIDADLSHDPALTTRMLERIEPGGVVIGSRYLRGAARADWAVARMRISILGNRYVRLVTGLPVTDCTSGFRCYTREAAEVIAHSDAGSFRARGFAFQVEALYVAWRAGCPLVEIPIVYRNRLVGESKLSMRILAESLIVPWRLVGRHRPTAAGESPSPRIRRRGTVAPS
jgi:dolichol-phosphate mannosyltransferase